ncbi:MAG: amino acid adenylation domain-containing protein [Deltaproteobacteria bacterium]
MNPFLLHQLLSDSAAKHPERDAVMFQGRSMTYAELDRRSDSLSRALRGMGVRAGDRVGIFMNKSIESIVFLFGILKAGAAYVPIDYLAPAARLEYIVDNCGIRIMFATAEGAGKIVPSLGADSSLDTIVVAGKVPASATIAKAGLEIMAAEDLTSGSGAKDECSRISDTGPAYILHTSGSTGMPKGVGLSHLNSLTFVNSAADYFRVEKEDRLACHAPLQFDLTVFDIFVAVSRGATIVLVPEGLSIFPMKLAQFIDEAGVTVWNSVASVLSMLAERGKMERFRFDSMRAVIFSGDVLPVKYLRKLSESMPRASFFNVYGQTEANSSTCYRVSAIPDDEGWKIPIGKALPNFEVFALGEDGRTVALPGETGELHVRSSSVAAGYWREEEKTSEAFVTDPGSRLSNRKVYRTGDLVTLDADGNYLFLGRKDQQVKSRGYRIQLSEIETVLNNHPFVKEAVAVAVPDELLGNRIISHVSAVDGATPCERDLLGYCGKILPMYMLPEKIVFHEKLPRTPTGKIDRNFLRNTADL